MQEKIEKKCNEVRDLLLKKNKSYGNSVFQRGLVFDVDPIYAIKARINDKLNRLKNNDSTFSSENDLMDLTGYLILLQVIIEDVKPSSMKNDSNELPTTDDSESIEDHAVFNYDWNEPKLNPGI